MEPDVHGAADARACVAAVARRGGRAARRHPTRRAARIGRRGARLEGAKKEEELQHVVFFGSTTAALAKAERANILKKHPNYSVTDVAKELGVRWKTIKDKSKYEKEAAKDKARYEAAMKKYKAK